MPSSAAPHIRPFDPADTEAVVALWTACGLCAPQNDPRRDIRRKLAVQPELFLVAEDGGAVVGSVMAGYDGHRGWLNYLGVAPSHRRQGLARALVEQAVQALATLGCPKVNLQVRWGNDAALAFYKAMGFCEDKVSSLGLRLVPDHRDDDQNEWRARQPLP